MWLIDVETRELKYFVSCPPFDYAILSHTWEDEEVTYREFRDGTGKEKKGYAKIMKTCDQARNDGWRYAWVDTCCINKESSAELSEAINSMWQYYRNAGVCYALLSDVGPYGMEMTDDMLIPKPGESRGVHVEAQTLWYDEVVNSRWFTRGWTLQELIAPTNLILFNSAWALLGRKTDLPICLSKITRIDAEVLADPDGLPLRPYTIAKKMSWAARRETSRIEDRAYSLLGLFNINMPLLYGEGKKAFIRLQEEIIKGSSDMSFLVWQSNHPWDTMDEVFADCPDRFANCTNVVPWTEHLQSAEFHLTNRGLEFKALSRIGSGDLVLACLNCRFEDNFNGPLALQLIPCSTSNGYRKTPYHYAKVSNRNSNHDYRIASYEPKTYSGTDRIDRVAVVRSTGDVQIREESATILRRTSCATHRHVHGTERLWVDVDVYSKLEMRIVDAFPKDAWNLKTGVMSMKYDLSRGSKWDAPEEDFAGITVELARARGTEREMSHRIDIGFQFGIPGDSRPIHFKIASHVPIRGLYPWVREESDCLEYFLYNTNEDHRHHQCPWVQKCRDQELSMHCWPLAKGLELVMKLRYQNALGEMVWVLELGAYEQNNEAFSRSSGLRRPAMSTRLPSRRTHLRDFSDLCTDWTTELW